MRLVADESCDFSVVVGVRGAGHDVIAIAELMPGIADEKVIELAASERRLLLVLNSSRRPEVHHSQQSQ